MKIKKITLTFSLIVALLYTDLFSLISYANSEKSETVKLSLLNIKNVSNGSYTHEIDLPKGYGELLNYTFDKTGQHTATGINSIVYDENKHKLLITFTMGTGKVNDVNGYRNDDNGLFRANPYNAVCRYSDGARWQLNEYSTSDLLPTYRNVDLTAYSKGKPLPYEFVFDVFHVTGKTTLNYKNEAVGYWVDSKGTSYTNDQIDHTTKTVTQNAIRFPSALNANQINYSKFTQSDPSLSYNYLTANLRNVINSEDYQAAWLNPSSAKPQSAMTGHAKCQQYEYQFEYYISAKTKPIHNIEGTFTYRYKSSDEPKLITTITADPTQAKFTGQDIAVKVTLKAELINVKNAAVVTGYKLYIRTEDNTQNPKPLGYELNGNRLKVEQSENFTIPASKLNGKDDYTEYFVGRAYAYFSDKTGTLMSDLVKASTYVYKDKPMVEEAEHEIKAYINGNDPVKLGDDTVFNAYGSYSTGSTIEGVRWNLPNAMVQPTDSYIAGQYSFKTWYNKIGRERAIVYIIDKEERQAGTYMDFDVVEPTIEAYISQRGTLKENRKVTLSASIDTPTRYPLTNAQWTISSLTGELDSYIRHEEDLSDKTSIDVLFKKAGEYIATLYVENSAGYNYETTYIVEIKEDKPPVAEFEFQQKIYRDANNNNIATFELVDYSYSFDGDYVDMRNWYVIFDANNDGIFNETPILFNTGNNTAVIYTSNHVGRYRFVLETIERFGEPTIEAYVTESDRRRTNTAGW